MSPTRIVVQGIEHPLPDSGRSVQEFCTPDWYGLVVFYPEFCRHVVARGEEPWEPQPWMLTVCKELERLGAREGRDRHEWMRRFIQHFGLVWLEARIALMKKERERAMRAGVGEASRRDPEWDAR
jgi:hypothetical protein